MEGKKAEVTTREVSADPATTQELNRDRQRYLDNAAETPYQIARMKLLTKLSILDKTHVKGNFKHADDAMTGIMNWLQVNPNSNVCDLLGEIRTAVDNARKDETLWSWSNDSKIFPAKLERIMWASIEEFIRVLEAKEVQQKIEQPLAGSESENKHLHSLLETLRKAEIAYNQTIALQKQEIISLEKEKGELAKRIAEQKAELEAFRIANSQLQQQNTALSVELKSANGALVTAEKNHQELKAEFKQAQEKLFNSLEKRVKAVEKTQADISRGEIPRGEAATPSAMPPPPSGFAQPLARVRFLGNNPPSAEAKIKEFSDYIARQEVCISLSRLNAVLLLGRFIYSSGAENLRAKNPTLYATLIENIKTLLKPESVSLENCLRSVIAKSKSVVSGNEFENAFEILTSDLLKILTDYTPNGKENLEHRSLFKGMQNLFCSIAFNVAELKSYFEELNNRYNPTPASGAHNRSKSLDQSAAKTPGGVVPK